MDARKWEPFIIAFIKLVNYTIMLRGNMWIYLCWKSIVEIG